MLIALSLISLVGMPAQHATAAITFWTVAYWFMSLAGPPPPSPVSSRAWVAVVAVWLAYTAGTAHQATTVLRPPVRAQRAGLPYSYGFYWPEPDGAGGEQRWARRRAAIVLDAKTDRLALTLGVNHFDIETQPVQVKVWLEGRLMIATTLASTDPITTVLDVPEGRKRVVLETWVSRALHPPDYGIPDDRELGLLMNWRFVESGMSYWRRGPTPAANLR
jgi:hypothetical protein